MGRVKVASLVVLAALLGIGGSAAYRAGWGVRLSRQAPIVEYRELHFDGGGQTGRVVTIENPRRHAWHPHRILARSEQSG